MRSLILLDRDGVINVDRPQGVSILEDFVLLPQALEAIALLKKAHFTVALVTNQALVGRGNLTPEGLATIHKHLQDRLKEHKIDNFFVCTDTGPSARRKPAPGMLLEAMDFFHKTPQETLMIGDDVRDFQAATAAGCDFSLVRTGKGRDTLRLLSPLYNGPIFDNLHETARWLIAENC